MAIVPKQKYQPLNTPQREVRGLSAENFGLGVARGVQDISGALGQSAKAAEQFANQHNVTQAKQSDTAFANDIREMTYGENGFFSTRGTASFEAKEAYLSKVKETQAKYRQGLPSNDSIEMYDKVAQARYDQLEKQVDKFVLDQQITAADNASKARIEAAHQDGVAIISVPGISPDEVDLKLEQSAHTIRAEMFALGRKNNQTDEFIEQQVKVQTGKMYAAGFDSVVANKGWDVAALYLDKYGSKMSVKDQAAAKLSLETGGVLDQAFKMVDSIEAQGLIGNPEGEAKIRELVKGIDDGKVRNEVNRLLHFVRNDRQAMLEAQAIKMYTDMTQMAVNSDFAAMRGMSAKDPTGYANMISILGKNKLDALFDIPDSIAKGKEFSPIDTGVHEYLINNTRELIDANLDPLKHVLQEGQYKELLVKQAGLRERRDDIANSTQTIAEIDKILKKTLGKKHDIFDPDFADIKTELDTRVLGHLAMQGGKIGYNEILEAIQREYTPVEISNTGGINSVEEGVIALKNTWTDIVTGSFDIQVARGERNPDRTAYVPIEKIPTERLSQIRTGLQRQNVEGDRDREAGIVYYNYLQGNKGYLREHGFDQELNYTGVKPAGQTFRDVLRAANEKVMGRYRGANLEYSTPSTPEESKQSFIAQMEGWQNKAYADANGASIGVGHFIKPHEEKSGVIEIDGEKVSWKSGLTDDQVHKLYLQDLNTARSAVMDSVTVDLTNNQLEALTSFTYNVGVNGFKNSTLLKKVNRGDIRGAVEEMGKWIHSEGKVNESLVNRRKVESKKLNG